MDCIKLEDIVVDVWDADCSGPHKSLRLVVDLDFVLVVK